MESTQQNQTEKKENDAEAMAMQVLFNTYIEKYQGIASFIRTLNFPQPINLFIMQNLDTMHLWIKEGFSTLSFNKPVTTPTPNGSDTNQP